MKVDAYGSRVTAFISKPWSNVASTGSFSRKYQDFSVAWHLGFPIALARIVFFIFKVSKV